MKKSGQQASFLKLAAAYRYMYFDILLAINTYSSSFKPATTILLKNKLSFHTMTYLFKPQLICIGCDLFSSVHVL